MITDKKLQNENRCAIFNYIIENPGKHFSEIMRSLNMTKRGLGYHLERLVAEGLIVAVSHGIFKYYYTPGADIKRPLTPMQQEIVDIIRVEPCNTGELANVLEKTIKAVEYHLMNLVKMDMVFLNEDRHWQLK